MTAKRTRRIQVGLSCLTTFLVAISLAPRGQAEAPAGRYTAPTAGTILDTKTGLTWQRASDTVTSKLATASTYCATLPLEGGGWRLPTVKELVTLVDFAANGSANGLRIDSHFTIQTDYLWTSNTVVGKSTNVWYVNFDLCTIGFREAGGYNQGILCVRP